MDSRTLLLDGIILAAASNPSGFSFHLYSALMGPMTAAPKRLLGLMGTNALGMLAVLAAILAIEPGLFRMRLEWAAMPLTLGAGGALAGGLAEWTVGSLAYRARHGRRPSGARLDAQWSANLSFPLMVLTLSVAVLEEILFRGVLLNLGWFAAGAFSWAGLVASPALYGLNHGYAGLQGILAKTAAGLVYTGVYFLSGRNLLAPILAHVLQNQLLFLLLGGKK